MSATPGPWEFGVFRNGALEVRGQEREAICEVWLRADPKREDANARLIAASPELLEALLDCADYLDCIPETAAAGDDDARKLVKQARAVIRKATQP